MVSGLGSQGLLQRCEMWGNGMGGVMVEMGGHLTLDGNTIRDHASRRWTREGGFGVFVSGSAAGHSDVKASNVFARNAGGNVKRER